MKRKIAISVVSFLVFMLLTGFMLVTASDEPQDENAGDAVFDAPYIGTWHLSYDNDRNVLTARVPGCYRAHAR